MIKKYTMTMKGKKTVRDVLVSILIGACVAFLSSLFEGIAQFLQGYGNDISGGIVAAASYVLRSRA